MNCASHCTISSVNLAFILWLLPMFKFVDLKIWIVWSFCLFVCLYYEGPLLLLLLLLLQFNKESNCWGCHNAATLAAEALAVLRVKTAESQTVAASFSSCFLHLFLNLNCLLTPINIPQVGELVSRGLSCYNYLLLQFCLRETWLGSEQADTILAGYSFHKCQRNIYIDPTDICWNFCVFLTVLPAKIEQKYFQFSMDCDSSPINTVEDLGGWQVYCIMNHNLMAAGNMTLHWKTIRRSSCWK